MAALAEFVPVARVVKTRKGDVEVWPLKMGQIPAFQAQVLELVPMAITGQYLQMITNHYDQVYGGVRVGTGLDEAFLADLYPDDFFALVVAVAEQNQDFFGQRLLPAIKAALDHSATVRTQMMEAMGIGPSSLPGLSSEVTGLPM